MYEKEIATVFKAVSDENRIRILRILKNGEKCACEISDKLSLSQSKLSYHMKILCDSKIVEYKYVGKWTHYKISKQGSERAMKLLNDITLSNV